MLQRPANLRTGTETTGPEDERGGLRGVLRRLQAPRAPCLGFPLRAAACEGRGRSNRTGHRLLSLPARPRACELGAPGPRLTCGAASSSTPARRAPRRAAQQWRPPAHASPWRRPAVRGPAGAKSRGV